jgi:hypothetical protein
VFVLQDLTPRPGAWPIAGIVSATAPVAYAGARQPGPDHGHPALSRGSREPAVPRPLPAPLAGCCRRTSFAAGSPGKEWLKVRTSDLDQWERVLRTIVPKQELAE